MTLKEKVLEIAMKCICPEGVKRLTAKFPRDQHAKDRVVTTPNFRVDVHEDIANPRFATAYIQPNREATDRGVLDFIKKGPPTPGAHKDTHQIWASAALSGAQAGYYIPEPASSEEEGKAKKGKDKAKKAKGKDGKGKGKKGKAEPISEKELYNHTVDRWLFNESEQLSQRYLKFNLRELLKAAVMATSAEGARYCTGLLRCGTGVCNKVYMLTMDNGSEIFAKLPTPIAGPAYYTTASEVATREFLRHICNIPIPRILAWSADRNNPVGAEYILEEKVQGKILGGLWEQWGQEARMELVKQIVEIERQLASIKFIKSGCIYFKGDIPSDLSGGDALTTSPGLNASVLKRFTMGPLTWNNMWCGDAADMDMNRGPYSGPLKFIEALAKNEIRSIQRHARPRINYHRYYTKPELPEEALNLLDRYLKLAPSMVPPYGIDDTHSPTLWHSDLDVDNIFVDPESKQITQIIDWQSVAALPLFYQRQIPKVFDHTGPFADNWDITERPEDYDKLNKDEQANINSKRLSEICCKYYGLVTKSRNPRNWAALLFEDLDVRLQPTTVVVNVWKDRNLFALRHKLLQIVQRWEKLCPGSGPCPVSFSEQELAAHADEQEDVEAMDKIIRSCEDEWEVSSSGRVHPDRYHEIRTGLTKKRDWIVDRIVEKMEKKYFLEVWPYQ